MKKSILILISLCFSLFIKAQGGNIDASFNTLDLGYGNGDGANSDVNTIAIQSNGKIIIGGDFSAYNGSVRNRIARLNSDGSIDNSFNPGTGVTYPIYSTSIQSDGKIIIGGSFIIYNGTAINRIARLNSDGTLDTSFITGNGFNGTVYSTIIQADGKIIIGGNFTAYNGTATKGVVRLNTEGTLDTSFNPGSGAVGTVYSTSIQGDGKIIIGGSFSSYNGTAINRVARLNTDGSLDTSFDSVIGANIEVRSTSIQPDGKIIIGGDFTSYNGTAINRAARLNTDGKLDTTFNPGTGANGPVFSTAIQADGKIIIVGSFNAFNGSNKYGVARLNSDGTLDTNFNITEGLLGANSIAIQTNGKIFIGGNFRVYNGMSKSFLEGFNIDGTINTNFNQNTGANNIIRSTVMQADGKIIIGGDFSSFNGSFRNRIARLNTDGTIDSNFNPGTGANGSVFSTDIQADGKIIIGGTFTSYNGISRNRIARLNRDGSLDTSFNPGTGANNGVLSIAIQADGKIIIGGSFTSFNGTVNNRLARLNSDGTLDTGFNGFLGINYTVWSIAIQADGKIIIGGGFSAYYDGTTRNKIARLTSNGTLDISFNPGTSLSTTTGDNVYSIAIQVDGKIIIGGTFSFINGHSNIARLNIDGTVDTIFNLNRGANNTVYSTAIQADNKIIIGGIFTSYNYTPRNSIVRLNSDGTLDNSFDTGTGANNIVYSTTFQADGKIIIGGGFTGYNDTGRNRIARINGPFLGVNDYSLDEKRVLIYNTNGVLRLETANHIMQSVSLFDITGKQVYVNINVKSSQLLITNLSSKNQILIVQVIDENSKVVNKKIVF